MRARGWRLGAALAGCLCAGAALGETAPPKCTYVEVAALPVKYAGTGLVPTIAGSVNGKPARILMDTGAQVSALMQRYAEKFDMRLEPTGSWVSGIGGDARLYNTHIDDMTVGPTRSGRTSIRVIGAVAEPPPFDAIIGAPFLMQADLEMNLAEREIKFFRPQDCKESFLAYWTGLPVAVIPYSRDFHGNANPHFTIELNGHQLDAMIDSGADTTVIELDAAKRAGLKLDAPDVKKLGDMTGIGDGRVAHWSAHFDKLAIGDEVITDARIGVMESQGLKSVDVLLGRDFLRGHRVLFARSQRKLYISYLGNGNVFVSQLTRIEPWIQREADEGNPDAEFLLAALYRTGTFVPQDAQQASHWLERAGTHGHAAAAQQVGRRYMMDGNDAAAAPLLRTALDQLPNNYQLALWLYIVRLRSGAQALGQQELKTAFQTANGWPTPIAQYYLGYIDAATLFAQAGQDAGKSPDMARRRVCVSTASVADLFAAQGKAGDAKALIAAHPECKVAPRPALAPGA